MLLPNIELLGCQNLAVPIEVMRHVVKVESGANLYAIGVVGGRLARQPKNLDEALATVRMLEAKGYNFSLGLAQVNRVNFAKYGFDTYEKVFDACNNLTAGSRILADCYVSAGRNWGKAFSCYYSGNFTTGFTQGYVQKIYDSISRAANVIDNTGAIAMAKAIPLHGEAPGPMAFAPGATATSPLASMAAMPPGTLPGGHTKGTAPATTAAANRIALRSVPLDNTANTFPAPAIQPATPGAVVPAAPANTAPATAPRAPTMANSGNNGPGTASDIFVPQVHSLGEAPMPQANANPNTAPPPGPQKPGADSAFVF